MNKAYITPTGSGTGDGSSWQNAAKLGSMNKLIEAVGPGGEVLVRADLGTYQLRGPLEIVKGGTAAGDVTIRGVDVNEADMLVHIKGTRMDTYTPGGAPGFDGLRLLTGADHLNIQNFKLEDMGRAIHVGSAIKDLSISNMVGENVRRFFDNDYRNGPTGEATISGLVIEDVEIRGFSKNAIRLRDGTNDVVIRNVTADSERQDKDNFAMGVLLTDQVHNVLIENTTMRNSHSTLGSYWNGDGFVTERGVSNVRFVNTVSTGNTDAGYDLKSSNTVLINAYAADNSRNYRIWSDSVTIIDSVSVDAHNRNGASAAHVWVGKDGKATFINLDVYEDNRANVVFHTVERGARVILDDVDIHAVSGVRMTTQMGSGSSVRTVDGSALVAQPLVAAEVPGERGMVASLAAVAPPAPPPPTVISVAADQPAIGEGQFGQTQMSFTVTRSGPADLESSVNWSVTGRGESAASAQDFVGDALPGGSVSFAAGETTKTVTIAVKADRFVEADEGFTVTLAGPVNGELGESAVAMTILNDDPTPTGVTVLSRDHAVDLSAAGNQVVTGPAHHNTYFVASEARSGRDTISNFGKDDVLVTTQALNDSNGDGLISLTRNTLKIDAGRVSDTVTFGGEGLKALRHLGVSDDGLNVYADASVRPARAIEGTLADDVLKGDAGDRATNRFFFDTALDLDLGADHIENFGAKDLLITTTKLADAGGKVALFANGTLELPGGAGAKHDGYFAGEGGTVMIKGMSSAPVTQLEYDGVIARKGVDYHVYSIVGSSAGLADF